jgi:hypothetical protein
MANRTVKDADGRVWICAPTASTGETRGKDVVLSCTTPSIPNPVALTVGWQWEKMAEKGLARLIAQAADDARRAA